MQEVVYTSEGNVAQAMPAVIMLVVGIGLATLMQIFIGVMGGQLVQQTEADIDLIAQSVTNETAGTTNQTGYLSATLAHSPVVSSSETVYCGGTSLGSSNYTLSEAGALVVSSSATYCNTTPVYAAYQYGNPTAEGYIKSAINYSFKAQQTTAQYMSTLVLAAIISVALVLIFGAFSMLGFSFGGGYGRGYGGYGGVL